MTTHKILSISKSTLLEKSTPEQYFKTKNETASDIREKIKSKRKNFSSIDDFVDFCNKKNPELVEDYLKSRKELNAEDKIKYEIAFKIVYSMKIIAEKELNKIDDKYTKFLFSNIQMFMLSSLLSLEFTLGITNPDVKELKSLINEKELHPKALLENIILIANRFIQS